MNVIQRAATWWTQRAREYELSRLGKIVTQINERERSLAELDTPRLRARVEELRQAVQSGDPLDDFLVEMFAITREMSARTLNLRHYDAQLLGGMVLHSGRIAEMKTGEGKTLVATLPLALNALSGKGVHLVTVNDYLARRDALWMGPLYHQLGFSVGIIGPEVSYRYLPDFDNGDPRWQGLQPVSRAEAYQADITYGTNNEFGFDYLRDHMALDPTQLVQRPLHFAIVDEVDNVLIDEARTPLIISGPAEDSRAQHAEINAVVAPLVPDIDYSVDRKHSAVMLSDEGIGKVERALGIGNLYDPESFEIVRLVENALKAHAIYQRDRDYVLCLNGQPLAESHSPDAEIVLVDDFTGRLLFGRRFSEGLHQAIEAKEGVRVRREIETLATITFQNYFRQYQKIAGMTGTALTEAEEFRKIYDLDVVAIPTHRPMVRQDLPDVIYANEVTKFRDAVREIAERHQHGQPVLVGTGSIAKSEHLSQLLHRAGIPHQVLNAKQHEREAAIIAQAGRTGAVTIATNMAGRGVDILLGGNADGLFMDEVSRLASPPTDEESAELRARIEAQVTKERELVRNLGGLFVLGTERHESRRIDDQLRGRAGRQGDPGTSRFFISIEDDLMQRFAGDLLKNLMQRLGFSTDEAIQHPWLSNAVSNAQERLEAYNFDIRKHVLDYDDVLGRQRAIMYRDRQRILHGADIGGLACRALSDELLFVMDGAQAIAEDSPDYAPDHLAAEIAGFLLSDPNEVSEAILAAPDPREAARDFVHQRFTEWQKFPGFDSIMRQQTLRVMDRLWIDHLTRLEDLRQGIGLRAFGQRDPLVEYQREAASLFEDLIVRLRRTTAHAIPRPVILANPTEGAEIPHSDNPETPAPSAPPVADKRSGPPIRRGKVRRNDPCPCGSGRKYKRCHGHP